MINGVIIAVIAVLLFFAIRYIVKKKANGGGCIGCPDSGCCSGHCECNTETKE